jgi:hypothetical protein
VPQIDIFTMLGSGQWQAYSFSSVFILYIATQSQKNHKLFSATYIICGKNMQLKDRRLPIFVSSKECREPQKVDKHWSRSSGVVQHSDEMCFCTFRLILLHLFSD